MDHIAPQVFELFNLWAIKVKELQLQEIDEYKL